VGFKFVDLFAGIGGFHAAMSAAGGKCVYGIEHDEAAAKTYEANWGSKPSVLGDITADANEDGVNVPAHDVLCAGFPCQPFSKSGAQLGMDETRGTLYWNILKIIESRRPAVVLLENVRNLAGPRHKHEWDVIIRTLRDEGYRVSDTPAIFSPHLLPPKMGGRPQVRERVFITASRVDDQRRFSLDAEPVVSNKNSDLWNPSDWDLSKHLLLSDRDKRSKGYELTSREILWIDAWDEFVQLMRATNGRRLPGFPLWSDEWRKHSKVEIEQVPAWKADFLRKNESFYLDPNNRPVIDEWLARWKVRSDLFPASRRKLEWQAQECETLWETVMHFRPSGIRAKAPTYLPALVAITQTSIIGPKRRRLSVREAARLQGLPDWFDFRDQPDSSSYRQLGNGVSVGTVWHVFRKHLERDSEILRLTCPRLFASLNSMPESPDEILRSRI